MIFHIFSFFIMNHWKYVFAQFMDLIPRYELSQCVRKYNGEYRSKNFSCLDQFLLMSFGQLTNRESLRSTVLCLEAHKNKLYHLWFHGSIARRTVSDANERRDPRIYHDFSMLLIARAQELYTWDSEEFKEISWSISALDSSTIDLCMSLFPWATFRSTKSAVKLHTLLDVRTNIPTFIHVTEASCADVSIWKDIPREIWSWYVVDRWYIDFKEYFRLNTTSCYFVTRSKKNIAWKRIISNPLSEEDKQAWVCSDQIMKFSGYKSRKDYPDRIRRVRYYDRETKKYFVFMTNNMTVSPLLIAKLYKSRWSIELFFKWIKQHLSIQKFYGFSENAVKTQICIALSLYVLAAILKKELHLSQSLYEILQIVWVSVFDKSPIASLFSKQDYNNSPDSDQMSLF